MNLVKKVGCLIWGRRTYEEVTRWDRKYLDSIKFATKIILSHNDLTLQEGFTLTHSPEEALTILEKAGYKEAILTGGAKNNQEFAKRGLVDEVIIDLNAVIVGEGIPLFAPSDFEMTLQLLYSKKISNDILELHYKVLK